MPLQKVCRSCGQTKPYVDFHKDRRTLDKHRDECILCEHSRIRAELGIKDDPEEVNTGPLDLRNLPEGTELTPEQAIQVLMGQCTPTTVYCPFCREEKPAEQFSYHRGNPNGLQTYCKECMSFHNHLSALVRRGVISQEQRKRKLEDKKRELAINKLAQWQDDADSEN